MRKPMRERGMEVPAPITSSIRITNICRGPQ